MRNVPKENWLDIFKSIKDVGLKESALRLISIELTKRGKAQQALHTARSIGMWDRSRWAIF
jgi:hypothetical protein